MKLSRRTKPEALPAPKTGRRFNVVRISSTVHTIYNLVLPVVLLFMVRSGLAELAIVLALLSKWRIFAVQPRYWLINLRTNAIDLIVQLSIIGFIIQSSDLVTQIAWTAWYIVWLILIKPGSTTAKVSLQAIIGQALGLASLFIWGGSLGLTAFVIIGWLIGYSSARHFFSSYEEKMSRLLAYLYGLFIAQLVWLSWHWSLSYFVVPQISIFTLLISYTVGSLYHHQKTGTLKRNFLRDQVLLVFVIMIVLIAFSDWRGGI